MNYYRTAIRRVIDHLTAEMDGHRDYETILRDVATRLENVLMTGPMGEREANLPEPTGPRSTQISAADRVIALVAARYEVTAEDIRSRCRIKRVAEARHAAIYLLRETTTMSLVEIGRYLGRDHSTVINSLRVALGMFGVRELLAEARAVLFAEAA